MNVLPFRYLLIIAAALQTAALCAQPASDSLRLLAAARRDVDSLCSPQFAGRGYQQGGHLRAAQFLARNFEQLGLAPAAPGYLQPFSFRTNVVHSAELRAGRQVFEAGTDFIVSGATGAGRRRGRVVDMGYGLGAGPEIRGKIALYREGLPPELRDNSEAKTRFAEANKRSAIFSQKPAALIQLKNKLTAGFSAEVQPMPLLEVQQDSLPQRLRRLRLNVKAGLENIRSHNVAALLPGQVKDSFVVLCAHYDHLGTYSGALFAGANDNASGTAMLLALARAFAEGPAPRYSMLFIAFGGEECGLKGASFFVEEQPLVPLDRIRFVLNLDLMGNGEAGIMAVCGKDFPGPYQQLLELNAGLKAVPEVKARPNAPNSDHYPFAVRGIPALFIYTLGGPPHYHDVQDSAANLRLSRFVNLLALFGLFLRAV